MKKLFAMLLVVVMVFGMLPVLAGAETATPEIVKVNMTLNSILDVNFKVDANGTDMTGYSVRVTVGSDTESQSITSYTKEGELYVYTAKLLAHRLPENIKVELVSGDTVVQTKDWTVATYLAEVKANDADNAELAAVADSLQNYGTYAAYYAAPTGTAPAVANVEAVTAADLDAYKFTVTQHNAALKAVTSLYLDDSCDLLVKFNAEAFAGCKLLIDGKEMATETVGTQAVCRISNILPQNWGKLYDIQVLDENGDTAFACTYGVLSYARAALGRATEVKTGLNGLLKAMYLYNTAAIDYECSEIPDWDFSTGKDSQGNYNSNLFTINQLTTYVGDPDVIYVSEEEDATYGGYYYMYGSNSSTYLVNGINGHLDQAWADQGVVSYNAPCFRSKDMVSWEAAGALGNWFTLLGYGDDWVDWSVSSVYAPEVIRGTDGKYYMYYTAAGRTDGDWATKLGWSSAAQSDEVMRHMLGIAVSDTPVGPFTPITKNGQKLPLVDFKAQAGLTSEFSILDPSPFVDDDGTLYLYFKEELRAGEEMRLFGMKMTSYTTADYSTLKALESNTKYNLTGSSGLSALTASTSGSSWSSSGRPAYYEQVIEAPQMLKHEGKYYLAYSRWGITDEEYSVWQSVGDSPLGNFTTETANPLLSGYHAAADSNYILGTAHNTFITVGDETFILYHVQSGTNDTGLGRFGYIDRVNFVDGKIVANGPSEGMGWQAEAISGYANIAGDAAISGVTDTNGYLTDSVIPYYSYNSSQVVTVSNGTTITLTYDVPVYARAIMVYSSLKKANAFTSVNIKITDADGTVNETGALKLADAIASLDSFYQSNGHVANAPVVAEFSDRYISKIEITVNGSGTMNIPEIVVLGRAAGTDKPANATLNKNYGDILYGSNGQGMVIDGSLSEAAWGEIYGTTTAFANGSVTFKTYTDDAGVYFAADVTDSKLSYSGEPVAPWLSDTTTNRNSWFDFYFYTTQPGEDIDYNNCAEIARFGTDLAGNVHGNGLRVKKAISQSGSKAVLEAFISWEQLGVPAGSRIRVLPQYQNADGTSLTLNTPSVAGRNFQDKHAYIEYTDVENVSNLVDFAVNEDGSVSFKAEPINTGSSKQWFNGTAGKAILAEATFVNDGSSQYQGGFALKDADGREVTFKMATWNGGAFYVNNSNGYGGYFDINYGIDQILGGSGMLANREPIQARMLYFNGNVQFFVYHNGTWQAWTKLQSLVTYMNAKESDTGVAFEFNTSDNVQVGAGFYGDANSSGKIENLSMEIDSERLSLLKGTTAQNMEKVTVNDDASINIDAEKYDHSELKTFMTTESADVWVAEATFQYRDWDHAGGFALQDANGNTMYFAITTYNGNMIVGYNTTGWNSQWMILQDNLQITNQLGWALNKTDSTPITARLIYNKGMAVLQIKQDGQWVQWSKNAFHVGTLEGFDKTTADQPRLDTTQPVKIGVAFQQVANGCGYVKNFSYEKNGAEAGVLELDATYSKSNVESVTMNEDGSVNVAIAKANYSNIKSFMTRESGNVIMAEATFQYRDWLNAGGFALQDANGNTMYFGISTDNGNIVVGYNTTFWNQWLILRDDLQVTGNLGWATDKFDSTPITARLVYDNGWAVLQIKQNGHWMQWSKNQFHVGTLEGFDKVETSRGTLDTTQPMKIGVAFYQGSEGAGYVNNFTYSLGSQAADVFSIEDSYSQSSVESITVNDDGSVNLAVAKQDQSGLKTFMTKATGDKIVAEATFSYRDWEHDGGFALSDGTNTMYFGMTTYNGNLVVGFNNQWNGQWLILQDNLQLNWVLDSTTNQPITVRLTYENGWANLERKVDGQWVQWSKNSFNVGTLEGFDKTDTSSYPYLDTSNGLSVGVAYYAGAQGNGYVDNFSCTVE